ARVGRNRRAERIQRSSLIRARQVIRSAARQLERVGPAAIEAVKRHPAVATGKIEAETRRLATDERARREMAANWLAAGGSKESFNRLTRQLANPISVRLVSGVPLALAIQFALLAATTNRQD